MDSAPPLAGYHYRFTLIYVLASVILAAIIGTLEWLAGAELNVGSGLGIGALVAAAYGAAHKFVRDQHRPPSREERRRLVWGAIGIVYAVSLIFLVATFVVIMGSEAVAGALYLLDELDTVLTVIMLVAFGVVTALMYGALHFGYGPLARMMAEQFASRSSPARDGR